MKLYSYYRSSASYRVRIGLALKGLAYEYVAVNLVKDGGEQHGDAHRARNLMEQVPVLEIEEGGTTSLLTQSVSILEYLDERYPSPPLLPKVALARAAVRRAVEIINSGIQPLQNLRIMQEVKKLGGDEKAFARGANEAGLAALEAELERSSGRYAVGDDVTLADVFIVPQMFSARRLGVDVARYERLVAIDAALGALPAFAAAHPDRQPDAV